MSTIAWPGFKTGPVSYCLEYDVQMTVMRNGRVLTYGLPGARWCCTLNFESELEQHLRPAIEAYLVSLEGGANRASLYHLARPRPNGTLRGAPVLASSVAAGARSAPLTNCNGTVKAGDMLGIGGQIVMVLADATPVSTNMTVTFDPPLRVAQSSGVAIVWDKPSTLFIPKSNIAGPFPYLQNGLRPGMSVEFVEAW
jgi:hypothetical protein